MTPRSDFLKGSLDALISVALRSSVAGVEPSPDVWKRIEEQVRRLAATEKVRHQSNACEPDLPPQYLHRYALRG
jgi:hypothetical protein